jgi:hypothetical protein
MEELYLQHTRLRKIPQTVEMICVTCYWQDDDSSRGRQPLACQEMPHHQTEQKAQELILAIKDPCEITTAHSAKIYI